MPLTLRKNEPIPLTNDQIDGNFEYLDGRIDNHNHGNVTHDGKLTGGINTPVKTDANGILIPGEFGSTEGTFCQGNDPRLSNSGYGPFGTIEGTYCQGNDVRLSNKRDPNDHTHVDTSNNGLTNDGKIKVSGTTNTTANLPLITGTNGVVTVGSFGTTANTFCAGNDSRLNFAASLNFGTTQGTYCEGNDVRLSNARTPTSHAHGDITNEGFIGSTADKPLITTTSGKITTGSFGTTPSSFAEGNHTHGNLTNNGAIGSTANLPLITTTSGLVTVGSFGTTANTFCAGNDSRLNTVVSHAHGNLTTDGKIGSTPDLPLITTTSGLVTVGSFGTTPSSFAQGNHVHGNLTTDGKIGSTANLPLITTTAGVVTVGSFGTTAGTFCAGDDSRLGAMASHTHGNISYTGTLGTTANLPLITGTNGLISAGSFGTTAGTFAQGNDSRFISTASNVQVNSLGIGTAASNTTGEIRATGNITAYYTSDKRLKENIVTIDTPLQKLEQIRGVYFDWNKETIEKNGEEDNYFNRKHDIGVIAQELEVILPEAVGVRPSDGMLGVNYHKIIPLLIEAIKELNKKIELLEANQL